MKQSISLKPLYRYTLMTAAATFLLLIAGSLVTSTDSGLAVPDWPLSYGTWFPPMVGGILYEHGHRMIAGLVGLMILVLAIWVWRSESRRWVRWLSAAALAAVFVQALLGGLTVLLLLPPQISIAHACLGQTVFCLIVCLAVCTAPGWEDRPAPFANVRSAARLRRLGVATAFLVAMQLVLGAVIRHTGFAVGWHAVNAAALVWVSGSLAARVKRLRDQAPITWQHAHRLTMLLGAQLLIGIAVWSHRAVVWLRTAHVALGALVLAQSVILAWELVRRSSSEDELPLVVPEVLVEANS